MTNQSPKQIYFRKISESRCRNYYVSSDGRILTVSKKNDADRTSRLLHHPDGHGCKSVSKSPRCSIEGLSLYPTTKKLVAWAFGSNEAKEAKVLCLADPTAGLCPQNIIPGRSAGNSKEVLIERADGRTESCRTISEAAHRLHVSRTTVKDCWRPGWCLQDTVAKITIVSRGGNAAERKKTR